MESFSVYVYLTVRYHLQAATSRFFSNSIHLSVNVLLFFLQQLGILTFDYVFLPGVQHLAGRMYGTVTHPHCRILHNHSFLIVYFRPLTQPFPRTCNLFACNRVPSAPVASHISTIPVHWTVGVACLLDQQTHQCHLVSGNHQLHFPP